MAVLLGTACAKGPLDYRAEAPLTAQGRALDSLRNVSVVKARSLGLTVYPADSAVARLQDLGLVINSTGDFLYADHAHGCGLFCKQVDFVIVTFEEHCQCVTVDAGSFRRPALLAEWRLVKPSSEIRALADSLASAVGAGVVHRSEIE
ncbi:MAG TPA: hypothetical protein VI159_08625 [Gemmatimonadales bacterium]